MFADEAEWLSGKAIWYSQEFADKIGVNLRTLQRWVRDGKIKPYKTKRGKTYYTWEHYLEYIEIPSANKNEVLLKVSSSSKRITLDDIDHLRLVCKTKLGVEVEVLGKSQD